MIKVWHSFVIKKW